MQDFFSVLAVCVVWYGLWIRIQRTRREWRSFVNQHPPVPYTQSAAVESWRWSDPPSELSLRKEDSAEHSLLRLPTIQSPVPLFGTIFGCIMILGGIYLVIYQFYLAPPNDRVLGPLFVMLFLVVFGRLMFFLGSKLVVIELQPDRVVFIVRYGVILFQRTTFRRGKVHFSGKLQSALAIERDQKQPNYYVFVKRWYSTKRYVTDCDPSKGSWLVAGLENWTAAGAK
jgi:hypothetical protein